MARIRGRGNKETEVALAKLLRAAGITGWRRQVVLKVGGQKSGVRKQKLPVTGHQSRITIRPDFIFSKQRIAVFVDGCFWHACPKHATMPASNRAFWKKKLTANQNRDKFVTRALRRHGWRVVRIWEHELRQGMKTVQRIQAALGGK